MQQTRAERREAKRKPRMRLHGAGIRRVYREAVLKRWARQGRKRASQAANLPGKAAVLTLN